jgi:hypothetical protein
MRGDIEPADRKRGLIERWRARETDARRQIFIDRFGRLHTADVLLRWALARLEAMGLRPVDGVQRA